MAELTFLDGCDARLTLNEEPLIQRFSQLVRLKPKASSLQPWIEPDYDTLFEDLQEVFQKAGKRSLLSGKNAKKVKEHRTLRREPRLPRNPKDLRARIQSRRFQRGLMGTGTMPFGASSSPLIHCLPPGGPFLPWAQIAPFGLLLTYEQVWTARGYTRGDLLNSFSLAPGEELTVETFTWDRLRLEQERSTEASRESQQSASLNQRISQETVLNERFKMALGEEVGGHGNLNLKEMEVPADVGADAKVTLNEEFEFQVQQTNAQVLEATRTATQAIRSSRKTRVTETVERGRETRTTRRIVNQNRCHTLNFDYFEILENYDVAIRFADLTLVALLPLPRPTLDIDWLLCHEHTIRSLLPDPLYQEGFQAARALKAAEIFRRRITPASGSGSFTSTSAGGDTPPSPPPANPVRDLLKPYVDNIVHSTRALRDADDAVWDDAVARSMDLDLKNNPSNEEWEHANLQKSRTRYRTWLLSTAPDFFEQVDLLKAACEPAESTCEQALDIFTGYTAGIEQAMAAVNFPQVLGLPTPSDAGLYNAIVAAGAAMNRVDKVKAVPPEFREDTPAGGGGAGTPQQPPPSTPEEKVDEAFGARDLALAQVEVERLLCHVQENLARYVSAIYADMGPAGWTDLLAAYPHVAAMVEPRLIAVVNGQAVFPLQPKHQRQLREEHADRIADLLADGGTGQSAPLRVVVPTPGMVLEARLGQCDACEDFIKQHRLLDLKVRQEEVEQAAARSRQERAEAKRREDRLKQDPPLLDDPSPKPAAIAVNVTQPPEEHG